MEELDVLQKSCIEGLKIYHLIKLESIILEVLFKKDLVSHLK